MIRHRVYITFWAYNVKSNTMRRLTGALDGYDLLINANEPELIKIGNIVYKAQLDSSPLKWSSGNVYIKLTNVQVQYFAHKVSPRFGTIWRPPDETWGELLGRYMNSCNRVLDAFERLMIEVVITASAKDIATGTDDFSYLHTYDDCMYGAGECPELLPMENETPIFGGFIDLSTISYDEQEQTFEFQVLGYDKWVDLIKTNRVLVSQYSDLYSILDAIAENIPWLKISTVAYQDPLPFRCQFLKLVVDASETSLTPFPAPFKVEVRTGNRAWLHTLDSGVHIVQLNGTADAAGVDGFRAFDGATIRAATSTERGKFSYHGLGWPGGPPVNKNAEEFFAPVLAGLAAAPSGWARMPFYPTGTFNDVLVWGAGFCWQAADLAVVPSCAALTDGILIVVADEDNRVDVYNFDGDVYHYCTSTNRFVDRVTASENHPYIIYWFSGWTRFLLLSPQRDRFWVYPFGSAYANAPHELTDYTEKLSNILIVQIPPIAGYEMVWRVYGKKQDKYYRIDMGIPLSGSEVAEVIEKKQVNNVDYLPERVIHLTRKKELWFYDGNKKSLVCLDADNLAYKYIYKLGLRSEYVALGMTPTEDILVWVADDPECLPLRNVDKLTVFTHKQIKPSDTVVYLEGESIGELLDNLAKDFFAMWYITPRGQLHFMPRFEGNRRDSAPYIIKASGKMGRQSLQVLKWGVYKHHYDKIVLKSEYGEMGESKGAGAFELEMQVGKNWHNINVGKKLAILLYDWFSKIRRQAQVTTHYFFSLCSDILSLFTSTWSIISMSLLPHNELTKLTVVEHLPCDNVRDIVELIECLSHAVYFDDNDHRWKMTPNWRTICYDCPPCESRKYLLLNYIVSMLNYGWCTGDRLVSVSDYNPTPAGTPINDFIIDHLDDYAIFSDPTLLNMRCAKIMGYGTLREEIQKWIECVKTRCSGATYDSGEILPEL